HERRGVGREVDRDAGELRRIAPAALRRAADDPRVELLVVDQRAVHLGLEVARRDRVHADAGRAELDGERARELAYATLRRRVAGDVRAPELARQRRDVDDAALL